MDTVFRDVTGEVTGLSGFQVKSVNAKGETLCEGAKGKRFLGTENDIEVDGETVFWVASCTKVVLTIALMQCVERGLVTLDTVPSNVLPELEQLPLLEGWSEKGDPILSKVKRLPTIREILSHQSGICVDISEPAVSRWLEYKKAKSNSQSGKMEDLIYPMVFSPGEGWTYSVGMDWIGHLICRLNGNTTLGEYFKEHIFDPLGIKNTTFDPLDDDRFRDRLTGTHWRQNDGTLKLASENAGNKYARSGLHNGGGGLWSTANDLCKLLHDVFLCPEDTKIISQASIREIATPTLSTSRHLEERVSEMMKKQELNILPQIPSDTRKNFGLGVAINLDDLETGLSTGSIQWSGFPNCYWWVDLKKGVVGAMVASVLTFADPQAFAAYKAFQKLSFERVAI